MEFANDLVCDFPSPCGRFILTFDDNGKVAHVYLKQGTIILGDVWIYNRCPTTDEPEWKDRTKLPFANCRTYMKEEGRFIHPVSLTDISVEYGCMQAITRRHWYLFGDPVALVGVGDKPSYSRFASRNGPLAKVLPVSPSPR